MFGFRVLDDCRGILLEGSGSDWLALRCTVYDLSARSVYFDAETKVVFEYLANRSSDALASKSVLIPVGDGTSDFVYGYSFDWPRLLVMVEALRASLMLTDHTKRHQAITYNLEAVVEDAIKAEFGEYADSLLKRVFFPASGSEVLHRVDDMADRFLSWDSDQRKRDLERLVYFDWLD